MSRLFSYFFLSYTDTGSNPGAYFLQNPDKLDLTFRTSPRSRPEGESSMKKTQRFSRHLAPGAEVNKTSGPVKAAPLTTPVRRLDNGKSVREPVVSWGKSHTQISRSERDDL